MGVLEVHTRTAVLTYCLYREGIVYCRYRMNCERYNYAVALTTGGSVAYLHHGYITARTDGRSPRDETLVYRSCRITWQREVTFATHMFAAVGFPDKQLITIGVC